MNLEEWLEAPAERFLNAWRRNLIAILTTFILNLLVAIGLLLLNLQATSYPAEGQVLVSLESEAEPPEADKQPAQEPKSWRQEFTPSQVRNIAVDANQADPLNAGLADEKQIDAQSLYESAARVRADMEANRALSESKSAGGDVDVPNTAKTVPPKKDERYAGPSVLSYSLKGRKALMLPVPAYQCKSGGPVVAIIAVDRAGRVVKATIDEGQSSPDPCLQEAAIAAALRSYFDVADGAPNPQTGSISYLFVPQK